MNDTYTTKSATQFILISHNVEKYKISCSYSKFLTLKFKNLFYTQDKEEPDSDFLKKRCGINNLQELKDAANKLLRTVDLSKKQKDIEHLLFSKANSAKILRFSNFINRKSPDLPLSTAHCKL